MKKLILLTVVSSLFLSALPSCASSDASPKLPSAAPGSVDAALFPPVDQEPQASFGERFRDVLAQVTLAAELRDGMVCGRATVLGVGPEICIGFVPRLSGRPDRLIATPVQPFAPPPL